MKKIILLGATGTIGFSTLEIIKKNPDKFKIVGASAHSNFDVLKNKIAPKFKIKNLLNTKKEGFTNYSDFLKKCEADIVLNAITGFSGLRFSIETLAQKIPLALANKESLVAGGKILMNLSKKNKTPILPVDSEHSAIFQCLIKKDYDFLEFKKIFLTCSGGPFFGKDKNFLKKVTLSDALKHPNWSMGKKITIDSATLANKCLEFFEAMYLFGAKKEQIQIVIQKESIVHSMVEFPDTSILAQLSIPDMQLPIAFALNYPKKSSYEIKSLDFSKPLNLQFFPPDPETFITLKILDYCATYMKNLPIVFNAVNEICVDYFLQKKIQFFQIFEILNVIVRETKVEDVDSFEKILEIDSQTREKTIEYIQRT